MAYTKTTWINNTAPAINATNLNNMETGIENAHTQTGTLASLTTTEKTNLVGAVNEVNASLAQIASAPAAWVPTVSGLTIGSGTITANYHDIGRICFFEFHATLAADSSMTGDFNFTLPHNLLNSTPIGAFALDASANVRFDLAAFITSTDKCYLRGKIVSTYVISSSASSFGANVPFTWATSDQIHVWGSYAF